MSIRELNKKQKLIESRKEMDAIISEMREQPFVVPEPSGTFIPEHLVQYERDKCVPCPPVDYLQRAMDMKEEPEERVLKRLIYKLNTNNPPDLDHVMSAKPRLLDEKNAHPRDTRINFFEESHRYVIDGETDHWISCTALKGAFFEPFKRDEVCRNMMKKSDWKRRCANPNDKYFGCDTLSKLITTMGKAADNGTELHNAIEDYLNGVNVSDLKLHSKNLPFFYQFQRWFRAYVIEDYHDWKHFRYLEQVRIHPHLMMKTFRTEWRIFDEDLKLAGSIDYLGIKEDGTFVIVDWKLAANISNISFMRNTEKSLLASDFLSEFEQAEKQKVLDKYWGWDVCSKIQSTSLVKYSIQLNIYRCILERKYGIRVTEMYLVHFDNGKPDENMPMTIKVQDMTETIDKMMTVRMVALQKQLHGPEWKDKLNHMDIE